MKRKKNALHILQPSVHGDAGRAEDQQQDSDLDDAGCVPRRSEDSRGVSQPGAQQVNDQGGRRGVVIEGTTNLTHGTAASSSFLDPLPR